MARFEKDSLWESALSWRYELHGAINSLFQEMRDGPLKEWRRIVANSSAARANNPPAGASRGRVLFFTPRYWANNHAWETVMAHSLRAEGYAPEFVGCGEGATHCDYYSPEDAPGCYCAFCKRNMRAFALAAGMPYRDYRDIIDVSASAREGAAIAARMRSAQECRAFERHGVPVGWISEVSLVRSFRTVQPPENEATLAEYRKFIEAAVISQDVIEALLREEWAAVVVLNGKFFAEALLREAAMRKGIPVLSYEHGFRSNTLIYAVDDLVVDFNIGELYGARRDIPLEPEEEAALDRYLSSRRTGKIMHADYYPDMNADIEGIVRDFGIDRARPVTVAFPNITWDSAAFRRDRFCEGLWDWLRTTIELFAAMPDQQLIVRVHPAEVRLPVQTVEQMAGLIARHFPVMPGNVRVIPPDSGASSYALLGLANRALSYTSTTGLEAALNGNEVIACGDAHYGNRGFTRDPNSREEYAAMLREEPKPLGPEKLALARRYAFNFFFRYSVPFRSVTETGWSSHTLNFSSIDELVDGDFPEVKLFRERIAGFRPGVRHYDGPLLDD